MQKLLIHITILFALILLLCTPSAYGQGTAVVGNPMVTLVSRDYSGIPNSSYIVDLGLSDVYWADRNVGANSETDPGNYYAWGEMQTKTTYSITGYQWYAFESLQTYYSKYWVNSQIKHDKIDNVTRLESIDDIAQQHTDWSQGWRMPTKVEIDNLLSSNVTTKVGNSHCEISNGSSVIKIPLSGYICESVNHENGDFAYFWSSDLYDTGLMTENSYQAYSFLAGRGPLGLIVKKQTQGQWRYYGVPVRPVIDKFVVTYIKNIDGETTSDTIHVPNGTKITLTASDYGCYDLEWTKVDALGSESDNGSATKEFTITSNTTITASFTRRKYSVSVSANPEEAAKSLSGENEYMCGDAVTISEEPNDCYIFSHWLETKSQQTYYPQSTGNCTTDAKGVNTLIYPDIVSDADFVAYYTQKTFPVTINAEYGYTISENPNAENDQYYCGTVISVTAQTDACHEFVKWSNDVTANPCTLTVNAPITLTAVYKDKKVTISTNVTPDGGGSVSGGGDYDCNASNVILTATPNECYEFEKWSDNNTDNPRTITIDGPATYQAVFKKKAFPVTINAEYGYTISENPNAENGQYYCGTVISVTAQTDACHEFVKWSNDVTANPCTLTVDAPIALTAVYKDKKVTISTAVGSNGGGSAIGGGEYDCNSSITLMATPDACYQFKQWSVTQNGQTSTITHNGTTCQTDPTTGINTVTVNVDGPATYTAEFEDKKVTIATNVTPDGGGSVSGGGDYDCNASNVILTATPNECYEFEKWSDNNTDNPRTITIDGPATYQAVFKKKTFTVTLSVNTNEGGSVSGEGTYDCGTPITVTATPNPCYAFTGWSDGEAEASREIVLTSDVSLTANFAPLAYSITKTTSGNGTGTIEGNETGCGELTFEAKAGDCSRFVGWADLDENDPNRATNPRTIAINQNTTITAIFEKKQFSFSATANDPLLGSVSGDANANYDCGTTIQVTAQPAGCSTFTGWSDGVTSADRTITLDKDTAIVAYFSSVTYTVDLRVDALGGGHVEGPSTSGCGNITIKAVPNSCYRFVRWENDETNPERTVAISSDTIFTASFEPIQYAITTKVNIAEYGTASASPETVICAQDAKVTLTATPTSSCYYLKEWIKVGTPDSTHYYINHNGTDYTCNTDANGVNTLIVPVTDDAEYIAIFALDAFEINATCDASQGSISINGDYTCGEDVTLVATPHECFQFVQLQNTVSGMTYPAENCTTSDGRSYTLTLPVTGDAGYVATFEKRKVKVMLIAEEGGSVIGGGDFYCDTTITLTARPEECYHFVKWSDEQTDTVRTYIVEGSDTLRAYFARDTFEIQVSVKDNVGGAVSGEGQYACGETATLTATASECYQFVKWSDGITANPRSVVVKQDEQYEAEFEMIKYTISINPDDPTKGSTVFVTNPNQ